MRRRTRPGTECYRIRGRISSEFAFKVYVLQTFGLTAKHEDILPEPIDIDEADRDAWISEQEWVAEFTTAIETIWTMYDLPDPIRVDGGFVVDIPCGITYAGMM